MEGKASDIVTTS